MRQLRQIQLGKNRAVSTCFACFHVLIYFTISLISSSVVLCKSPSCGNGGCDIPDICLFSPPLSPYDQIQLILPIGPSINHQILVLALRALTDIVRVTFFL